VILPRGYSVARKPSGREIGLAKRIIDLSLAAAALVFLSPLMAVVAAMVKTTSPGPVFYKQERVGLDRRIGTRRSEIKAVTVNRRNGDRRRRESLGRPFDIYKFRSMVVNAERGKGPVWASPDDPRVTPLGKYLRLFRIDELPQLWNVIKGEMSIVGPRPERPHFVDQFKERIPRYHNRLHVPPGITGLAQVLRAYDSSEEDVRLKSSYDNFYVDNRSLMLDLKIMAKTVGVVAARKGAV
jgi:lipopolysaccharide/colanic/teichoic acid biosynthesis glycosyltransferase